ncbi:3D domain-containing protein [Oceanobacillus profundus]|nr:3D domain-containing protein [Oceanobacillus profundus]
MKKLQGKAIIVTVIALITLSVASYHLYSLINAHIQLKREHENVIEMNKSYQEALNDLEQKKKNVERSLLEAEQEIEDKNSTLKERQQKIDGLKEERQSLEQDIKKLKSDLEAKQEVKSAKESNLQLLSHETSKDEEWRTFTATYYDANYQSTGKNPGDIGYGVTASGKKVESGVTIAVDPDVIPLGSWVMIKYPDGSTEKRRADDTGSAIQGHKVDIYINQASITSGKHQVQLKIL